MDHDSRFYCPTCFAIPGEECRTKYVVHGDDEVTAVLCPTHGPRLADSEREALRDSLARLLCAVVLPRLQKQGR